MIRLRRRERVLLMSTLVAIAMFIALSWWAFGRIEMGQKAELRTALQTVLETSHQAFTTWAREERAAAQIWATAPEVVRITRSLIEHPQTKQALLATPDQTAMRNLLSRVQTAKGYEGYFVISLDGINLSSSRDENIGMTNLLADQPELLATLHSGQPGLSLPQASDVPLADQLGEMRAGRPTMFVGAPIVDAAGEPIAILTFRLNPYRDFTALFQRGRIGRTGESYAFDRQGRLISESRFDEQLGEIGLIRQGEHGLLNIEIRDPTVNLIDGEGSTLPRESQKFTRMAAAAISGESGFDVDGYRDYRGVPVVSAWLWDSDSQIGITTEIDVEEAFETLAITRSLSITMTTIASLLLLGVAVLFIIGQRRTLESSQQLEAALTKVLRGYLPICASCKKIRDDDDVWHSVEEYVSERTAAAFTHSMCPDCGTAYYGDQFGG